MGSPHLKRHRIAVCTLDSVMSLEALNRLFDTHGGDIGLVLSSQRFGDKYGGFWRQFRNQLRRSGLRFTIFVGTLLIGNRVCAVLRDALTVVSGRPAALASLRQLADRFGTRLVETGDANSPETLAELSAYAPDLVIVLHFDHILRQPFIDTPRLGVINVHPSLLPELQGPFPSFWCLSRGQETHGVTLHHIVDEGIDDGPIVSQLALPVRRGETVAELEIRMFGEGVALLDPILGEPSGRLEGSLPLARKDAGTGTYMGFPRAREVSAFAARGGRLLSLKTLWTMTVKRGRTSPDD
jgi:folate-dependent phosphoribosylglycinamide formyltransferase PurN